MSLIVYECQGYEHQHESRQFHKAAASLYEYFNGRPDELAVFIGNVNIGLINLDGLLLKNDAVVIVEFKDYAGKLKASQNGHWTCDGKDIKGGSNNKSVFDQLKSNRRNLRDALKAGRLLEERQYARLHALVVLNRLDEVDYGDLDDINRKWITITDMEHIGSIMPQIKMGPYKNKGTGRNESSALSNQNIWDFIRKLKIDERALITDYSATSVMPADLFHADKPHSGKKISTEDELQQAREELEKQKAESKKQAEQHKDEIAEIILGKDKIAQDLLKSKNEYIDLLKEKERLEKALKEKEKLEQEYKALQEKQKQQSADNTKQPQQSADVPQPPKTSAAAQPPQNPADIQQSPQNPQAIKPPAADPFDGSSIITPAPAQPSAPAQAPIPAPAAAAPAAPKPASKPGRFKFGQMARKVLKTFNVSADKLDTEQLEIIEREMDRPLIIGGTAGSGKSIIAVYKTEQILESGCSAILISFTKSLRAYMSNEMRNTAAVYHYHGWVGDGRPRADYIIVDEVQDFSWGQILEFVHAAGRAFFFFGDTAQSIYRGGMKLSDIAARFNLRITRLHNNYRLPKTVACIAQQYIADRSYDWDEYNDSGYRSTEKVLPYFLHYADDDALLLGMIRIIKAKNLKEVGILLPKNKDVLVVRSFCEAHGLECDFKYNRQDGDEEMAGSITDADSDMILDFTNQKPKILSYHSAKGLQFETVIMPFVGPYRPFSAPMRRAAYVAMTRTYRYFYLLYSSELPPAPFDQVPAHLYQKQPPV